MKLHQKVHRVAWFVLASMALWAGLMVGGAAGETLDPPMGLAEVKPATPMGAFTLPSLNSSTFDSSVLQNKVVVVRFWATW
jgi:cytochrome oxidase Cu insertion factor (SCO1/SenC/PrrC family)